METETDDNYDTDETETNYEGKNKEVDYTTENENKEKDYENEDGGDCHLFQIEMVNGNVVWACNMCEYGFDSSNEMQTHMKSSPNKVINIEEYGGVPGKYTVPLDEGT